MWRIQRPEGGKVQYLLYKRKKKKKESVAERRVKKKPFKKNSEKKSQNKYLRKIHNHSPQKSPKSM